MNEQTTYLIYCSVTNVGFAELIEARRKTTPPVSQQVGFFVQFLV